MRKCTYAQMILQLQWVFMGIHKICKCLYLSYTLPDALAKHMGKYGYFKELFFRHFALSSLRFATHTNILNSLPISAYANKKGPASRPPFKQKTTPLFIFYRNHFGTLRHQFCRSRQTDKLGTVTIVILALTLFCQTDKPIITRMLFKVRIAQ